MHSYFPSWWIMLLIDMSLIVLAVSGTVIVVNKRKSLKNAGAIFGVCLILIGLWTGSSLYIADLYTMIILPAIVGEADAMAAMRELHLRFSWYFNAASALLIFLGLAITISRLVSQILVTQHARTEAELHSQQKSAFLASMSHELRTPLNAVIGYSQFMQQESIARDEARTKEYAERIEQSGQLLSKLVEDLLDLSQIESGKLTFERSMIDLPSVVLAAVRSLEMMAHQAGVKISTHGKGALIQCHANPRAIEQITNNLLSNAIKHTPEGGRVWVTVESDAPDSVRLIFGDTGEGIPPEFIPHLFEPFVHTDPMRAELHSSYGLGLPICKGLVEAHGGTIDVESTYGTGTVITIELPTNASSTGSELVAASA